MKTGLCAWSFTGAHREVGQVLDPFVPEDLARMALDRNLQSIECAPGPLQEKSPDELQAFKEFLARHELDIVLDTGGTDYREDTAPLRATLEMAHQVGASLVRTTISNLLEGDRRNFGFQGWKDYLQGLVKPLKEIMSLAEAINAIRALHQAARPPAEDWRTPHERGKSARARVDYEMEQLEASVAYLEGIA